MRRVVPLLCFALLFGCVAEESTDENIGSSYQRVILLDEGEFVIEGQVAPGDLNSLVIETDNETLFASAAIEEGDVAVMTSDEGIADETNHNCLSEVACTEALPRNSVSVSTKTRGPDLATYKLRVIVTKCDGSNFGPLCGISTSP